MCAQLILLVLVLWTLHEQSGPEATYGYSGGDGGSALPPERLMRLLGALALSQLVLWAWATQMHAEGSYFLLAYTTVPGVLMLGTRCAIAAPRA